MDEMYRPNSNKYKEEQKAAVANEEKKKLKPVVNGAVRTKKKGCFSKFKDELVSDTVPNIKTYIVRDVIIPTIKNAISGTVDMFLFGGARDRKTTVASKVSYGKYYDERNARNLTPTSVTANYTYDDIIYANRVDAEEALMTLEEALTRYEFVSVADVFDVAGLTGKYTDQNYGWTSLRDADIQRIREGGYIIKFPKAMPRPR